VHASQFQAEVSEGSRADVGSTKTKVQLWNELKINCTWGGQGAHLGILLIAPDSNNEGIDASIHTLSAHHLHAYPAQSSRTKKLPFQRHLTSNIDHRLLADPP